MKMKRILVQTSLLAAAVVVLSACSSRSLTRAPVEDRNQSSANSNINRPVVPTRPLKGQENAGKPGYYTVQAGDNVFRIAKNYGRTLSEVARWNGLYDPYIIEIGDVLRVIPPAGTSTATTQPVPPVGSPRTTTTDSSSMPVVTPVTDDSALTWGWPASGPIAQGFDSASNKGIDIAGKAGDSVIAAADGTVVYSGNALRGYGNLVILKHNSTFVTAYAHNQTLLVKDGQTVKRGQRIAEMGQSEADRVKLHFEIRKNSTPVDPMRYLPPR